MSNTPVIHQLRSGTAAAWTAANPVLREGEIGWEVDTKRVKVGDGVTAWADLEYGHLNSNPRTLESLGFSLAAGYSVQQGEVAWNVDEQTLDLGLGGGVVNQIGQEVQLLCRNGTGSTINDGTVVMFIGTIGNSGRLLVAPMVSDGSLPGYVLLGVATASGAAGEDFFVTVFGKVRGINTSAWAEGTVLWCDPAVPGGLTAIEPHAPSLKLAVAAVISSKNNGILMVRATAGDRLQDLHDVEANGSKSDGDLIHWSDSSSRWEPTDRLTLLEQRVTALEGN